MPSFGVKIEALEPNTADGTWTLVAGIKLGAAAANRLRLRSAVAYGMPYKDSPVAPVDAQIELCMARSDNTTDGAGTTQHVNTIAKLDPDSAASEVALLVRNYTSLPTTIASERLPLGGFNARGTLVKEWHDPDAMPKLPRGATLLFYARKSSGGTNPALFGLQLEWDEC